VLNTLDIHKILEFLPHRYPFLLIDRVLSYTVDESLTAIKNVSFNEPYFQGHFPYRPVMPGVLILESMVQASAVLASLSIDARASDKRIYYFVGVDKARFKRPVEPGDQLVLEVAFGRKLKGMWKCTTTAKVEDQICCTAEVMFTYKDLQ
jgi:3-hydroxyacyl-[acyl-carrier-protein] dehydratase